ncbi:MAG: ectoine/hydroxyectoine ABC transporter substrate-binding protein EhuB [Pseudonocardiaceae bacterium]|nr:ectoine/hydroxyectoine ABC transporter substrate-binding protein EhuB [Pseudonocardiaceae bacterium]
MSETQFSRRTLFRFSLAGAAALGGGTLLGACTTTEPGGGGSGATGLSQRVEQGQSVRIAIANEPPYTRLQPNGEITGAAPDVAKAVLARMGIENVEGVTTDYDTMIPGLDAGRWDIVAAGLFMDEERCARVRYSAPVLVSTESFATPRGNPMNITSVDAVIGNPDVTVAVLSGSYELRAAQALEVPDGQLSQYPGATDALQALSVGRVDAVLLPTLTLQQVKDEQGGDFDVTDPLGEIPKTGSGAAFRQSDGEFHGRYNRELMAFKETEEFASLLQRWGFDATASREATTEELCAVEAE